MTRLYRWLLRAPVATRTATTVRRRTRRLDLTALEERAVPTGDVVQWGTPPPTLAAGFAYYGIIAVERHTPAPGTPAVKVNLSFGGTAVGDAD